MKKTLSFLSIIFLFSCNKSSVDSAVAGGNGQGGSLARFTIVGNYLYSIDKSNLRVFNITTPSEPAFVSSVPVGFEIETIYPFRDKLFIGSTSVVHIFSIADPAHPQKLGEAISPEFIRRCDPVVAKENVAYATLRTTGPCGGTRSVLAVYDITNIEQPIPKDAVAVGEPYGLGYLDNALYVCDKLQGLVVFDITQPFHPTLSTRVNINAASFIDVIPYNDVLICWTTSGVSLYDISSRLNPTLITQIN